MCVCVCVYLYLHVIMYIDNLVSEALPDSAMVESSSIRSVSSTFHAPSSPPQARPHSSGRPMNTWEGRLGLVRGCYEVFTLVLQSWGLKILFVF